MFYTCLALWVDVLVFIWFFLGSFLTLGSWSLFTAVCGISCMNKGVCIAPDVCACSPGFEGEFCQNGKIFIAFTVLHRAVATLGVPGVRHPPGQISVGKSRKCYIQSANQVQVTFSRQIEKNLLSSIRAVLCDSKKPRPKAMPTSRHI